MRRITIFIISIMLAAIHLSGCSLKSGCESYEELAEIYFQAVQENNGEAIMKLKEPDYISELEEQGINPSEYYSSNYFSIFEHDAIKTFYVVSTIIKSPAEETSTFEGELADSESYTLYGTTLSSGNSYYFVQVCYSIDNRWYLDETLAFENLDLLPTALQDILF